MTVSKVKSELKGVALEAVLGIAVKIFSVSLSIVLIPKIAAGDPYFLQLVYGIGLVNMAKLFDGSLPYLQRINHPNCIRLSSRSELNFSILVYTCHIIIFFIRHIFICAIYRRA